MGQETHALLPCPAVQENRKKVKRALPRTGSIRKKTHLRGSVSETASRVAKRSDPPGLPRGCDRRLSPGAKKSGPEGPLSRFGCWNVLGVAPRGTGHVLGRPSARARRVGDEAAIRDRIRVAVENDRAAAAGLRLAA